MVTSIVRFFPGWWFYRRIIGCLKVSSFIGGFLDFLQVSGFTGELFVVSR